MTRSPARVLFAIPSLDRGGPDRVMFELLRSLDRARFRPALMVSESSGHYLAKLPSDVEVTTIGDVPSARYPFVSALRHVRRSAPDLVFSTLRMNLTLGLAKRLLPRGTRLVLRPASPVTADMAALVKQSVIKHRLARRLLVAALRDADGVICQSRAMQRDLSQYTGSHVQMHVVNNPIDVDEIEVRASEPATVAGHPSLVSVGRLVPLKAYDVLLRALVIVRRAYPSVHLTIIGDGPERANLERLRAELALDEAVTFMGYLPEPLPFVRAGDAFVLASRYDAFSNATLEALACGTPVVLTDVPGANAELLVEGVNGRLAPHVEPASVAAAIGRLLDELASYDREAIRADCRGRFGTRHIVGAFEHALDFVLGRSQNRL